jgi:plasmid stabilization system protein ParE
LKVVWSPVAKQRAIEAATTIARDRPQAAVEWVDELITRVASLDEFALRGRVVPEIGRPEYRQIVHAPYRVIYRVDARRVVVLTLRHNRRAWDSTDVESDE